VIGTSERRPTLLFNGYGEYVADLYKDLRANACGRELTKLCSPDGAQRNPGAALHFDRQFPGYMLPA